MTIASGELNLQSNYNYLICHIAKVKVSMSAPFMADISILVYYSSVFNVCFESNANASSWMPTLGVQCFNNIGYILHTLKKTIIYRYITFSVHKCFDIFSQVK